MTAPSGYERLLLGHAVAVARADLALNIRRALVSADGTRCTLHEYASRHPAARRLQGRTATFAVPLPQDGGRVVVRHNHHGGFFGPVRRDLFLSPTRAPYELDTSIKLARAGVPTPEVVAYALYPPGALLQRSDVATREISGSRDLAHVLTRDNANERAAALTATAELVVTMSRAGARHHDLNAKNVLLTHETAYILDVDRVMLGGTADVALEGNLSRLSRSLRKWRDQHQARVTEKEIEEMEAAARRRFKA